MFAAVVVGFVLLASATIAQVTSEPDAKPALSGSHTVAVLDLVRIFNECAQIQDLNEMMKQQTEEAAKEAQQRRRVIEDKQSELSAFRPGTQDFVDRRKDLARLNIDANVWFKVTEQVMDQDKFDWTRVIYENVMKSTGEIARQRGFDVVLLRNEFKPDDIEQSVPALRRAIQERSVVWNVPEIDITDLVIRKLDQDYKAAGGAKTLGPSQSPAGGRITP